MWRPRARFDGPLPFPFPLFEGGSAGGLESPGGFFSGGPPLGGSFGGPLPSAPRAEGDNGNSRAASTTNRNLRRRATTGTQHFLSLGANRRRVCRSGMRRE